VPVQSRLESLSPVVKKLSVELAPDRVAAALNLAFQGLARSVKMKGYRQGHVPRRLVEKVYGDDVKRDVAQKLVEASIGEALEEHALKPVAPPRVENGEVLSGQPFKYVATVEVRPKIEPKDYEGLSVPAARTEVSEAQLDEELDKLRQGLAQLVPVEGREVAEAGDVAGVDSEGFVEGAPIKGSRREGGNVEVAPGSLLEGKCEALIGAHIGETREQGVTFPADWGMADLRGKEAVFKVTLKGLKKREVPALDDAFAQDVDAEAKTLADLRAKLRGDLEKQQKERAEHEQRTKLLEALVEKNPVEAPPALVERNVDAMLNGMLEGFGRRGLDVNRLGLNVDKLRQDLRARAQLEVKGYLLLDAVADKEGFKVAPEEVEAHYEKLSAEMKQPVEKIRLAYRRSHEAQEGLTARIRQDKALAFLLAKANLT
jgi:trigger factor